MTDIFGGDFWRTTRRLGAMAAGVSPDAPPVPGQPSLPYTPHQPQQQRQRSIFENQHNEQAKLEKKRREYAPPTFADTPNLVRPKQPLKPGEYGIL